MLGEITKLVSELGLSIYDSVDVPPRPETLSEIPPPIIKGPAFSTLIKAIGRDRLWTHQAEAIRDLCAGSNVVISTGTASGKSLVFQIYALHRLLSDPDSRVLVFYPLRALANDQLISWKHLMTLAGLPPQTVSTIYGGISMQEREDIIEHSKIVLMTPDVCQAWLMPRLGEPLVNNFIASLNILIIDEAHVYESVFGSNAAYLIRRLVAAKQRLPANGGPLQIVAATATIDNPGEHLKNLTGSEFNVVEESSNGAPRTGLSVLHVEGPEGTGQGEETLQHLLRGLRGLTERHPFLAFVDSRMGVERIARAVDSERVRPYRSGYESADRMAIERSMRDGTLDGVVSTSALELGIDIPNMDIGVNLGVPQSRKSFRQRLGRIGRASPGVFIMLAPRNGLTKFGEGLQDYYNGSIEPSYLYLGNRFVQFAHARCLADELEALGGKPDQVPSTIDWPTGFADVLKSARTGYPREFDPMAQIGADSPHHNYPLRQLGETNVEIVQGPAAFQTELGDMAYHQAIREAYPGATYLHMGRAYTVDRWSQGFNKLSIHVSEKPRSLPTRPLLRKSITIDLSQGGIMSGRIMRGPTGLVAEAQVQVNESVEGYTLVGNQRLYREERTRNPNMRRKQRDFRTTGIVIQIDEDWFADREVRMQIADGLRDLYGPRPEHCTTRHRLCTH